MLNLTHMINVTQLSFSYRRAMPVLEDVSFTVSPGDFVAIIGSNGAGKSTLLKLLLNQLSPDAGEIRIFGEKTCDFQNWACVGYVPQGHSYLGSDFPATVEEILLAHQFPQIGLFGRVRRIHREKVRKILTLVDMESFRTARLGTLSGGQLQRILIARALVNDPKLMILDEPTNGIDVKNAHALYELLDRLNRDLKLTIVMVTHDLVHASTYAQKIFCIEEGNLATVAPAELHHELQHRHHHHLKEECEHFQTLGQCPCLHEQELGCAGCHHTEKRSAE